MGLEPKNAVPVALIAPYAGMAELARKLESSAPAGDWAEIEQLAGRIDQELLRSSDFINQYQVRLIA